MTTTASPIIDLSSASTTASNIRLHKEYAPIFGTDKSGKTRVWYAVIFAITPQVAKAVIQHGIYGGKLQVDSREYTAGKNIGKKNETTALDQCVAETDKKRQNKIDKEGYREDNPRATGPPTTEPKSILPRKIFPMLANKYDSTTNAKKRAGISFPCFVQPKLDGLRCVVYLNGDGSEVVYQSRTGGYFAVLRHLDAHIKPILASSPGLILDGELYTNHIPFEELVGIVKKKALTTEDDFRKIQCVQYHVYDVVLPHEPFRERLALLQSRIHLSANTHIIPVPTYIVTIAAEFKEKFAEFVTLGYEGIMLRNIDGLYQENYRSNDLMKYKEFFESEYRIVGFKEASGRDAGTVIWECETPEGRRFHVRPRGTVDARKIWFENAESIVGKNLTVIYQELSEMGVPRFPVGKAIRDGY